MQIDEKQIRGFLKFLNPRAKYHWFAIFGANKEVIAGRLYVTVDEAIATLRHYISIVPEKVPTLHVTINGCSHLGKSNEHVQTTQALCVDIDSVRSREEIREIVKEYSPDRVVESSPGKFHLFWAVDSLPIETWKTFQLALASKFGGDLQLVQPAHLIRIAGIPRTLKDSARSMYLPDTLVTVARPVRRSIEDLGLLFPWWEMESKRALKTVHKSEKKHDAQVKQCESSDFTKPIKIKPGSRNITLYRAVLSACRKSKYSDEEEANAYALKINALIDTHSGGPLDIDEVTTTAKSAFKAYLAGEERKVEKTKEYAAHLTAITEVPTNCVTAPFQYDYSKGAMLDSKFSSAAVVEMVGQKYGRYIVRMGTVLYAFCPETLVWIPQKPTPTVISDFSLVCTRDLFRDSDFIEEFPRKSEMAKFLSHNFLSGVTRDVMVRRYPQKQGSDFDTKVNLLFCANGVVNMDTGRVRDAEARDYLLRKTAVKFDASAKCPRWEKFIGEVFSENEDPLEMIAFIQNIFGYSLTGSIGRMELYVHCGSGSNGKSKVLQALADIAGDYGTMMAGTSLTKNKKGFQQGLERIGVEVEGKRCVIVDDLDTATQWNEGIIKNLTGKKIMARNLYAEKRDIPNRAKFHIGCNQKPVPESENFAIIRRLCLIPYNCQFKPTAVKEAEIQDMLEQELSGILNWAIEGHRMGQMEPPAEVKWELNDYQNQHFVAEDILREIFEKPGSGEEIKENWYTCGTLFKYADEQFERRNADRSKLTPELLWGFFRNTLQLKKTQLRFKGQVCRGYYVILAGEKKNIGLQQLQ